MPIRLSERASGAYVYPLLIKHLLHRPLATAAEQEIVYKDCRRYTYRTFNERLSRLANALEQLGVEPGTTVAVLDRDSHRYLECFFAIPMMGAVLQTVNVRLSHEQILYTMQHARAEVVLVHRDFLPILEVLRPRLGLVRAVILLEDSNQSDSRPAWINDEYERSLTDASTKFEFADFDEDAVATTFYTTGTTGDPKGVCFSHRQIVLHTLAALGAIASGPYGQSFRHGDVYMPMTPMFHVHAWGNPYIATLLGVKQVFPGRYHPEELLALRARESVTYSHCVPTILQMLLTAVVATGADVAGWKMCIGGSALSAGLAKEALRQGIDVFAGYGMSETGPVLSISHRVDRSENESDEQALQQRCSAGLQLPLVDLQIIDSEFRRLPHDGRAVGEIVVRAPWATMCYLGNSEASEELWRGGYLHTQDVASIDGEGFIQITDRIKDVIKSGGEWLSSLDIENVISRHPGVAEVTVIAIKDPRWGERPHVLVVARESYRMSLGAAEIRQLVAAAVANGELPPYSVPERITLLESIEKTSVGKVNKRSLRNRYG